jgi:hypothetical protein
VSDETAVAVLAGRIADVRDESRQRLLAAAERFRAEQTCGYPGCTDPVDTGREGGRNREFCSRPEHNAQAAYWARQKSDPPLQSPWKQRLAERNRVIREVYATERERFDREVADGVSAPTPAASFRGISKVLAEAGVDLHHRQVWQIVNETPPVALVYIVAGDPDGGPHVHVVLELDHPADDVRDEERARWREHACAEFSRAFGTQPEAVVVYVEDQTDDVAGESGDTA